MTQARPPKHAGEPLPASGELRGRPLRPAENHCRSPRWEPSLSGLIGVLSRLSRRALYVGLFLLYAKRSTSGRGYFFVANQLFRGVENEPWLSDVGRIQRLCD